MMMVADAPVEAAAFLSRLVGRDATASAAGLRIPLDGGAIAIMDPLQYRGRTAGAAWRGGTGFAGMRVAVADLAAAEAILRRNDVSYRRRDDAILIDALGTLIELGVDT
jgi:hypothetical protein